MKDSFYLSRRKTEKSNLKKYNLEKETLKSGLHNKLESNLFADWMTRLFPYMYSSIGCATYVLCTVHTCRYSQVNLSLTHRHTHTDNTYPHAVTLPLLS